MNRLNSLTAMPPEPLASLPDRFTVYLARHASPDRTRSEISYHTLPGPALTEDGLQDAQELGAFFQSAGIVRVLSSPFERAHQTAKAICEICVARLAYDPDLSERQPVEIELALVERMRRAFAVGAKLSTQHGPVALISHGAPILSLLRSLGLPGGKIERCRIYDNRNLIPMAGAWRVERVDGELKMRLVFAPRGAAFPDFLEGQLEGKGI